MKYKDLYGFQVMSEIEKGKTVYFLDRKARAVNVVNELTVNDAMALIKSADECRDRFEFWVEEEENENAEEL